jgi:hypothetical protein
VTGLENEHAKAKRKAAKTVSKANRPGIPGLPDPQHTPEQRTPGQDKESLVFLPVLPHLKAITHHTHKLARIQDHHRSTRRSEDTKAEAIPDSTMSLHPDIPTCHPTACTLPTNIPCTAVLHLRSTVAHRTALLLLMATKIRICPEEDTPIQKDTEGKCRHNRERTIGKCLREARRIHPERKETATMMEVMKTRRLILFQEL